MKNIFKIGVPIFLISLICIIGYKNYKILTEKIETPLDIIPNNAALIIQSNKTSYLDSYLKDKFIFKKLKNIPLIKEYEETIKNISSFYSNNKDIFNNDILFISLHKYGAKNTGVLLSCFINKSEETKDETIIELLGDIKTTKNYDKKRIAEVHSKEGLILYTCIIENFLFTSQSIILVQDAIRQYNSELKLNTDEEFNEVYKTINSNSNLCLIYNINHLLELAPIYTKDKRNHKYFASWAASDVNVNNNSISINGFSRINSKFNNFSDILLGQKNKALQVDEYIPENTAYIFSLAFGNANKLYENKNHFLQNHNNIFQFKKYQKKIFEKYQFNYEEFTKNIKNEAGIFYCPSLKNGKFSYIQTNNAILATGLLQKLILNEEVIKYKTYDINKIIENKIIVRLFGNLLDINETPYFTNIEDILFFSNNPKGLKYIIDNYNSKNTLRESEHFTKYKNIISINSNLFLYINIGKMSEKIINNLKEEYQEKLNINKDSLNKFTGFSFQLSNNRNLLVNNITLLYNKHYKEYIKEKWSVQLDTNINTKPQVVYNHFTKDNEILIQDKSNKIYLFSSDGILRWEKEIDQKILGNISQIDFYKNQKTQILFNTKNKLHLIDRNGDYVARYPIKLPEQTNIGHSLFDYEKLKEYRILIVGLDNNIYNLNKKGGKVIGWKYQKTNHKIIAPPTHLIQNGKDYILCISNDKISLLARNGSKRSELNISEGLTKNPIQINQDKKLYAINNEGKLWIGELNNTSNKIDIPNLNISSNLVVGKIINDTLTNKQGVDNIIFSNGSTLYIIDDEFNLIYTKIFESKISHIQIKQNQDLYPFIMIQTEKKLHIWKNGEIIEEIPIDKTNPIYNICIFNNKTHIINKKNDFLLNYELDI